MYLMTPQDDFGTGIFSHSQSTNLSHKSYENGPGRQKFCKMLHKFQKSTFHMASINVFLSLSVLLSEVTFTELTCAKFSPFSSGCTNTA